MLLGCWARHLACRAALPTLPLPTGVALDATTFRTFAAARSGFGAGGAAWAFG